MNTDTKTEAQGFFARLFFMRWLRRLYDWVLHWAETPYGEPALFLIALAEASFFPIPPDVLLIVLALSIPKRAFRYAGECLAGSLLGGALGYLIGLFLFDTVGIRIIEFYGLMEQYYKFQLWYEKYNFWIIFTAGFTPLPYKVFTISAGVAKVNFLIFFIASLVSRGARFFLVSGLIWKFGEPIKDFIEKYFDKLVVVFTILLLGGFFAIKLILPSSTIDQNYLWDLNQDSTPERIHFWNKKEKDQMIYYLEAVDSSGKILFHQPITIPEAGFAPSRHNQPGLLLLAQGGRKLILAQIFSDSGSGSYGFLVVYQYLGRELLKRAVYRYDYYQELGGGRYQIREVEPKGLVKEEGKEFLVVEESLKEFSQEEPEGREISRGEVRIPLE